jgi:calcineurin-like phosphoesterase family protein
MGRKHLIAGNNDDAAVNGCDGWESIQAYAEVSVDGMHLVLCHYPFRTGRNMDKGWANFHGHSHGRLKPLPRQFDVGVEVWNFRPLRLAEVHGGTKAAMQGPSLNASIPGGCAHPSCVVLALHSQPTGNPASSS